MVLGTKKLRIKPQQITPMTTRLALAPSLDKMTRAIRLSSPVFVIAVAKNMAAATRQKAVVEKPLRPMPRPAAVPKILPVAGLGAKPISTAMSAMITPALTG